MVKYTVNLRKLTLTLALLTLGAGPALADSCFSYADRLNYSHSLNAESVDPYSHLMSGSLDAQVNPLANSYKLDLKPLVVNDLTKLQFKTYDTSSPAAGYTSPYLWEAGGGPGYRGRSRYGNLAPSPYPFRR